MANEFIIKNGYFSQGNSAVTGSLIVSNSLQVTGSINVLGGITGSLFGTASYVTGSIFDGNNLALSSSYALTASYFSGSIAAPGADDEILFSKNGYISSTGSFRYENTLYALTITHPYGPGVGILTLGATPAPDYVGLSIVGYSIATLRTGSNIIYYSNDTYNHNINTSVHSFTGSVIFKDAVSGSFTGSLFGTASYVTGSVFNSNNLALSSSYSLTASYINGMVLKNNGVAGGSFSGNPKKYTVTFSSNFSSTDYSVTITGEDSRTWTIENKQVGQFTINSNSNTALANTVYWQAIKYGEFTS